MAEIHYTATVRPDHLVRDLIDAWINGNCEYVLNQLAEDHPALVALFITQGAQDRTLSLAQCNTITNLLIDRRAKLVLNAEQSKGKHWSNNP